MSSTSCEYYEATSEMPQRKTTISNFLESIRNSDDFTKSRNLGDELGGCRGHGKGMALTWKDLTVSMECRNEKFFSLVNRSYLKRIVENVSGVIEPGHLVALIGPSGAGKSTILSALARRTPGNAIIDGDVRLNGRRVDDSIRKVTGYMYQEDYFISILTVREHLRFMSRLKMDRRTSRRDRENRIETLMNVLSLSPLADSRIGGYAADGQKGVLSGGEKKRLSFATAILTLPPLLFADEPTTGLDSFTANRLVSVMKSLVQSTGASMIATIHQPSPEILAMFDTIYLVAEGRLVFSGTADNAVQFLLGCGFTMNTTITDCEFLLKCVAPVPYDDKRKSPTSSKKQVSVRKLAATFEASDYHTQMEDAISKYGEDKTQSTTSFVFKEPFWIVKLFWLVVRGMVELGRNPNVQWIRIGQKLLIGLTAGICYFGTLKLDQKGVQSAQGAMFLLVTENVFAPMYAVIAFFPQEYPLFIGEHRNGAYSPSAYYLSKILCYGPGAILEAVLYTSLLYALAGLRLELYPYILTTVFTILCISVATAVGAAFSNTFSSIPKAMMFLLPVEYIAMITSGIFVKLSSLPWATAWLKYTSWFMYTYESISVVQWQGVENIACPANDTLSATCLRNGHEVLEHYDFSESHLIRNAICLVVIYVIFQILGYKSFARKNAIKEIVFIIMRPPLHFRLSFIPRCNAFELDEDFIENGTSYQLEQSYDLLDMQMDAIEGKGDR
ncbi:ATP-Hypothetical protein cassette, sub-family G (WHITE), member [Nesidiocoris tenuis]|uniref:ABC transporter domain-containing protein n=1 Tax=Nesidiocoris tenuis TaxID=355587 RepID=A0ABN7AYG9_9HEMI|nr:ATP-Hypothetical protein cassette, sub-family G (WHITE), member [Nesidiocoris tenuis]